MYVYTTSISWKFPAVFHVRRADLGRHFLIRKFQAIRLLCAFVVETGLYIDGDGEVLFG